MSKIIRISKMAFDKLNTLESDMGISKQLIIEKSLDRLIRENLLRKANEAYAALRNDPQAWEEEIKERQELEATLADGLEDL